MKQKAIYDRSVEAHASEKKVVDTLRLKLRKRETTLKTYAVRIRLFCDDYNNQKQEDKLLPELTLTPDAFRKLELTQIEDLTENFINRHLTDTAPKSLNVFYCAIKAWVFAIGKVTNRKMFKEIVFDSHSRANDAIMEMPLEPEIVRKIFDITDVHERAVCGVYAINGFRPALIPQMRISWIFPQHYKIENNVFKFVVKNPFLFIPKNIAGNKATGTTFFNILHSRIASAIEQSVNMSNAVGTITPNTYLINRHRTKQHLYDKIKSLYAAVGFTGRPYLMRSFADYVLDEAGLKRESGGTDEDFKEQLMMHKGVISGVYQGHALPETTIAMYTKMYQAVETWVSIHIFGAVSAEQNNAAKQLAMFAKGLGVSESQIQIMLEALENGKTTFDVFNNDVTKLCNEQYEQRTRRIISETIEATIRARNLTV